jgi:hypothetical protein
MSLLVYLIKLRISLQYRECLPNLFSYVVVKNSSHYVYSDDFSLVLVEPHFSSFAFDYCSQLSYYLLSYFFVLTELN